MIIKTKLSPIFLLVAVFVVLAFSSLLSSNSTVLVADSCPTGQTCYFCGIGTDAVQTSINFGCKGTACQNQAGSSSCPDMSPITDMIYAIIRFLSIGVGVVVVASMVYAGMQYIGSRGEPQATQQAISRIRSNVIAILVYIFAYAILSFVIPPGFLN